MISTLFLAILKEEEYDVTSTIMAKELCSSLIPGGAANNIATTAVDVPVVSSPSTLQTSYGAVVDATTTEASFPSSSDTGDTTLTFITCRSIRKRFDK